MLIKIGKFEYTECWDGVLPLKIKDEIVLKDYVYAIIIPKKYKKDFDTSCIKEGLKEKVYYIENNCKDIWTWTEKVYGFVKNL